MALDPLSYIGTRRAAEGAFESSVPVMVAGASWYVCYRVFSGASAGRPATDVELCIVLGAFSGIMAWAVARQFFLVGRRKPLTLAIFGTAFALAALAGMGPAVRLGFANLCVDALGGQLVSLIDLVDNEVRQNGCQLRPVPSNAYLQGTLILPIWDGRLSVLQWLLMAFMGLLGSVGLRSHRLRKTQIGAKVDKLLRLAPAAGSAAAAGAPPPTQAQLVACKNPTLWGEPCAQVYGKEKVFLPGEWCARCNQAFTPADRILRFKVVSLFTAELDVLNGLERQDTLSWDYGATMDEDPRISGQERWVVIGDIELPDVLTVSQALAYVHEVLGAWSGTRDERVARAAKLAMERASRICAWIWFGRHVSSLTYARPTTDVAFAAGPTRLRDLVPDTGRELMLQLDIGLLPLEVRTAFRQTFLSGKRGPLLQNSKRDVWVPVGPLGRQAKGSGIWVDRIEGEGLRTWLSTARIPPQAAAGVPLPLPYHPVTAGAPPAHMDLPDGAVIDLVRRPLDPDTQEPIMVPSPGESVAEWAWLEWEQIELLRRQCLVQVVVPGGSK